MSEEKKETIYVTTENDYFNSADGSRFSLAKGQVKRLPSKMTPIVSAALEQGLLREVNLVDLERAKKEDRFLEE